MLFLKISYGFKVYGKGKPKHSQSMEYKHLHFVSIYYQNRIFKKNKDGKRFMCRVWDPQKTLQYSLKKAKKLHAGRA